MLTVVYNLVTSAAIAAGAYMLVEAHKDAKEHILQASELRLAALGYIGGHCSDHDARTNVNPQRLINEGHLDPSFNDHGAWIRMRLADYPQSMLVTRGTDNSRFRAYLDSLEMGQPRPASRRWNRFTPDPGVYRVANAGLNFLLINGYSLRCEPPADRVALWSELCAGLANRPENDGMTCNDWTEET